MPEAAITPYYSKLLLLSRLLELITVIQASIQRAVFALIVTCLILFQAPPTESRQWWVLPRTRATQLLMSDFLRYTSFQFRRSFRFERASFDRLLDEIKVHIMRSDTNFRAAVPPYARLMIFIYHIATGASLKTLSNIFGQGRSTCGMIVKQISAAINIHLRPQQLCWPSAGRLHIIMAAFEEQFSVPQCIGLMDGTHIPIRRPNEDGETYWNRKGYYSLNVEGKVRPCHSSCKKLI